MPESKEIGLICGPTLSTPLLKVTLPSILQEEGKQKKRGQDVRDEALKIAEDWPGVRPRQS